MRKGDIFLAINKEDNPHPIVFIEQIDNVRFKACIISTKPTNGNIPMTQNHFHTTDKHGNQYRVQFNNSYLIPDISFTKMIFWLNSEKVMGRLTEEGIIFIENHITEQPILCPAPIWKYRPVENE